MRGGHRNIRNTLRVLYKNRFIVQTSVMVMGVLILASVFGVTLLHVSAYWTSCPGPNYHRVWPGDSLGKIAINNHTDIATIMTLNHGNIADPNLIYVGQAICLPGGSAKATNVMPKANIPSSIVQNTIQQVFGPYAAGALNVARCESSFNPNAINSISVGGSNAEGVFQILWPSTWQGTSQVANSPYDYVANIHAAYEIFSRDGFSWREWVCQP